MKPSLQGNAVKLMNSIRGVIETHPRLVAFFMVFAFIAYYNVVHKAGTQFHFDSGQYWDLQRLFFREDVWSLLHYNNPLRGYFLPLVFHALSVVAGGLGITGTLLLGPAMAMLHSTGITIAVPFIVEMLFQRKATFAQICLFAILVAIFWRGYLYYPLADFPALFSIIFMLLQLAQQNIDVSY